MSIRVIEPGDKLLITVPKECTSEYMRHIVKVVDDFRDRGNLLILNSDVYVMKGGEQVLLEDELKISEE